MKPTATDARTAQLRAHFARSSAPRPLLTSLNGDHSWLHSYPRPAAERAATGKAYYHIVEDPWLAGSASMFSSWVGHLTFTEQPCAKDPADVETIIAEIEAVAWENQDNKPSAESRAPKRGVDAICINFHYLDHLHEPTLRLFDRDIPVFVVRETAPRIRAWNHFTTVIESHDFDPSNPNWASLHPGGPLPSWLNLFRLVGDWELHYATVVVWSHDQEHEAILSAPHGIYDTQESVQAFATKSEPPIKVPAILHALHDSYSFGKPTTLGVKGGLALERLFKPKYWVLTHDAKLSFGGVGFWLSWTKDVARTLEEGLAEEGKGDEKPNFVPAKNGDLVVVE